jgi:hypothetical protein
LAAYAFADLQPFEGWLFYHGISHVHPDFTVAHLRGGVNMKAIDYSHDAWDRGNLFQRNLLGRDAWDLPFEDYGTVRLDP